MLIIPKPCAPNAEVVINNPTIKMITRRKPSAIRQPWAQKCRGSNHLKVFNVLHMRLILNVLQLPSIHAPKDYASIYLCGRKGNVKHWRSNLESQLPSVPEATEKVHCHDCFNCRANCCRQTWEEERSTKEGVPIRVDAIQNDRYVWEKLRNDIESAWYQSLAQCKIEVLKTEWGSKRWVRSGILTPYRVEDKFDVRIWFPS